MDCWCDPRTQGNFFGVRSGPLTYKSKNSSKYSFAVPKKASIWGGSFESMACVYVGDFFPLSRRLREKPPCFISPCCVLYCPKHISTRLPAKLFFGAISKGLQSHFRVFVYMGIWSSLYSYSRHTVVYAYV